MDNNHTFTDGLMGAIWAFFFGMLIFGVLRLLMLAYLWVVAIVWAFITELVWPLVKLVLKEIGIALLRTFNRVSAFFA